MKIFKSQLFGNIPEPESFDQLIQLIIGDSEDNVFMWRGQSNIDWRVDHSAYRRLNLKKEKVTEFDIISYEDSLLKHATHRGYRYQNGHLLSDFELLALLQHHGAATRLVDFSRNAFVALYFSLIGNKDKNALLLGINSNSLGGYEGGEYLVKEYRNQVKGLEKYGHCQTWEPPIVTPRIAAQHSQFIYSRLSKSKMGSIELEYNIEKNKFICINAKLKKKFEEILISSFDLRYQTLFPDIDGFGDANSHIIDTSSMYRW